MVHEELPPSEEERAEIERLKQRTENLLLSEADILKEIRELAAQKKRSDESVSKELVQKPEKDSAPSAEPEKNISTDLDQDLLDGDLFLLEESLVSDLSLEDGGLDNSSLENESEVERVPENRRPPEDLIERRLRDDLRRCAFRAFEIAIPVGILTGFIMCLIIDLVFGYGGGAIFSLIFIIPFALYWPVRYFLRCKAFKEYRERR